MSRSRGAHEAGYVGTLDGCADSELGMYFRDIQIQADEIPENELGFPFSWSAHHVKEGFMHFLAQKFVLDGSSKLTILCGPREFEDDPVRSTALGTTTILVEDFDFAEYKRSSPERREEIILELIVGSLSGIVFPDRTKLEHISKAAAALRAQSFSVPVATRLSRSSPDRREKCRLVRTLSLETGESWCLEICSRSGDNLRQLWVTERPGYLDRRDMFRKLVWLDDHIEIRNRQHEVEVLIRPSAGTVERWGRELEQYRIGPRYDREVIDISQRAERAVARAGHAYQRGLYQDVVRLLEPYWKHLSPKQRERLDRAREHLARPN